MHELWFIIKLGRDYFTYVQSCVACDFLKALITEKNRVIYSSNDGQERLQKPKE